MGNLGLEPRTNGLRVRCATIALVTLKVQHLIISDIRFVSIALSKFFSA